MGLASEIVTWVVLALVVALIVCVIVLFVIKTNKNTEGDRGPQGVQGDRGTQGPGQGAAGWQGVPGPPGGTGDRGFQGLSGSGIAVSETAVNVLFSVVPSTDSVQFPDKLNTTTLRGLQSVVGNVVTLSFSNIIVFAINIQPEFKFNITLPSSLSLSGSEPIVAFSGSCDPNRQTGVVSQAIPLHDVKAPVPTQLRFRYRAGENVVWNGAGGEPQLFCNFTVSFLVA